MQWLSRSDEAFAAEVKAGPLDVLVVGSGYGGAVAALRFAQAGRQVTVLERGEEYVPGEFPNDISQAGSHVRAELASAAGVTAMGNEHALFDLRIGHKAGALVGNGLGGTSLINAGVGLRADPRVFRQARWPAALRQADLDGWYEKAERELELQVPGEGDSGEAGRRILASDKLAALRGFAEAARSRGVASEVRFRTVPIAVELRDSPPADLGPRKPCIGCGDCITGCNHGAKLSLTATYLPKAWRAGARFFTGITVLSLAYRPAGSEPAGGGAADDEAAWEVTFIRTAERQLAAEAGARSRQARAYHGTVRARTVILAAGAFGSTEILLRSRARGLPVSATALGMQVSGNGDDISFGYDLPDQAHAVGSGPRAPERFVGPTIAGAVELRDGAGFTGDTLVEDGGVPAMLSAVFGELASTLATTAQMGRWSFRRRGADALAVSAEAIGRTLPLLGMGHDEAGGTIAFDIASDRVLWAWPDADREPAVRRHQQRQAAVEATGALHLGNPAAGVLPPALAGVLSGPDPGGALFTVHPLGGCRMGDSHHAAVVNDWGAVFRSDEPGVLPGLYVLDGSIVPTALGVNPLLTITALAERACETILRHTPGSAPAAREFGVLPHLPAVAGRAVQAAPGGILTEVLRGALDSRDGPAQAALFLNLQVDDWRALLAGADHRAAVVPTPPQVPYPASRLELQVGEQRRVYEVLPGSEALLFRVAQERPGGVSRFLALAATVLIDRWIPDALKRQPADRWVWLRFAGFILRSALGRLRPARSAAQPALDWIGGFKLLRHAMEVREFRYELALRGPDGKAYRLQAVKRLDASAGWREIGRWWRERRPGEWRPLRRRSVWEQLTQADAVLLDESGGTRLASGRLRMDLPEILRRLPSQLAPGADSVTALMAAAAYPLFVARVLLKTRLLDFRAPDYKRRLPDTDPATLDAPANLFELWDPALELPPLCTAGGCVPPERAVRLAVRLSATDASTIQIGLLRFRPASGTPLTRPDERWGRTRVKSILLINGFAQNTRAFVAPELGERALASRLHAEGWDVWMLEYRVSPLLRASARFSSMDDIAAYDIPAAVAHVREAVEMECGLPRGSSQVFAFSHCVGSASLAMSILGGHLADWEKKAVVTADGRRRDRAVPWLAGVLFSQFHPFVVGSVTAQQRLQVGSLLRNVLRRDMLNFTAGAVRPDLLHAMLDRLFASFPYAFAGERGAGQGERCPGEHNLLQHRSDCATCKRMSGILSRLFNHEQLLPRTHRRLDWYFGRTNLGVFLHGARCVEYERLVSENGQNVYATDRKIGRYLTMPVMLLHGQDNVLFDRESLQRTAGQLRRVGGGPVHRPGPPLILEHEVAGFAHFDCTVGRQAPEAIFEPVARFFGDTFEGGSLGAWPSPDRPQESIDRCLARVPLTGPLVGWTRRGDAGGWLLRVWFELDLGSADRAVCGLTRMRFRAGGAERQVVQSWGLRWTPPMKEPGDPERRRRRRGLRDVTVGYCVADLEVPDGVQGPVAIEALSVHRYRGRPPEGNGQAQQRPQQPPQQGQGVPAHWGVPMRPQEMDDRLADVPLHPAGTRVTGFDPAPATAAAGLAWFAEAAAVQPPEPSRAEPPGERQREPVLAALPLRIPALAAHPPEVFDTLMDAARGYEQALDAVTRRVDPGTLSRLRRRLSALDHARIQWSPPAGTGLRFLAAACRHPGLTAAERDRADLSLLAAARQADGARFMLMLGDQIYADARAGLFDSASEIERLVPRYRQAFGSAGFRALASRLPLAMILDDHEINENWSLEQLRTPAGRQRRANALHAYRAFQYAHGPSVPGNRTADGYFEHDGVWFFLLDTRTGRRRSGRPQVMRPRQWDSLRRALQHAQRVAPDRPKFICSGSVLAPGLWDGAMVDDGHLPRSLDTWQHSPDERGRLLALLSQLQVRNAVLLSSDYHCSAAAALELPGGGRVLALCAPPLHAPLVFANTRRQDMAGPIEAIALGDGRQAEARLEWAREGDGWLDLQLDRDGDGWRLRAVFHLRDMLGPEPQAFVPTALDWRL